MRDEFFGNDVLVYDEDGKRGYGFPDRETAEKITQAMGLKQTLVDISRQELRDLTGSPDFFRKDYEEMRKFDDSDTAYVIVPLEFDDVVRIDKQAGGFSFIDTKYSYSSDELPDNIVPAVSDEEYFGSDKKKMFVSEDHNVFENYGDHDIFTDHGYYLMDVECMEGFCDAGLFPTWVFCEAYGFQEIEDFDAWKAEKEKEFAEQDD